MCVSPEGDVEPVLTVIDENARGYGFQNELHKNGLHKHYKEIGI